MAIENLKLNDSDFSGQDVSSLPDRPSDAGITTSQLKARFDMIGKAILGLGRFNSLVDALISKAAGNSGADNIGISPIEGISGDNVQAALGEMGELSRNAAAAAEVAAAQGNAAETAANAAQQAADRATEAAEYATENVGAAVEAANEASAAAQAATTAIIEVKSYAEEKAQESKDYVDNAILESGAVTSVFGRAGAIEAQAGDYTAQMVGAIPADDKGAAGGVASLDSTGKVPSGQLPSMDYIPTNQKGAAGGVASLGSDGKVPESQLPEISVVKSVNGQTGEVVTVQVGTTELTDKVSPLADKVIYCLIEG